MTGNERVLVHATSVVLDRAAAPFGGAKDSAVLLLGDSGVGKSDVALRLIGMGAKLLSDDQTVLFVKDGRLMADTPPSLHGQMEIRGVGIVKMVSAGPAVISLAVYFGVDRAVPRLPEPATYRPPAPLQPLLAPPLLTLRAFEPSTPVKIAAAAAAAGRGSFVAGAAGPSSASSL